MVNIKGKSRQNQVNVDETQREVLRKPKRKTSTDINDINLILARNRMFNGITLRRKFIV